LCPIHRYTVAPEQYSFLRIALRANGGRFDDSLLALVRPVAGARQPRLVCTSDHAGFHLLVTVRPRNAQLLGADTRPLVGLTKTIVDGTGAGGGEAVAPRSSASEGKTSPFARRRSDSDVVVEPERARAAMPPSPSVAREAPSSPAAADLSPAVESLRMTVLQLEQARREVATEAAALKSEHVAITKAEATLAGDRRALETKRDALRAEREELAAQRRLFEDRMAGEMDKLAAEWRSLRTAQGAHAAAAAAAAKAAASRQHMAAPASAWEQHSTSLGVSSGKHEHPAGDVGNYGQRSSGAASRSRPAAITLFLAGVTLSLLLAACLFALRYAVDSRAAMRASAQASTLVTARNPLTRQVALRAPAAAPRSTSHVHSAGTALTSWLMAAARSGVQRLRIQPSRPSLALPPPKRGLNLTVPWTQGGAGSRLWAQAGLLRRGVSAVAACLVMLVRRVTMWSFFAAFLVALAWGVVQAAQQLSARLHARRQGGGKKKAAHHYGAGHHGHAGGHASGGHVHGVTPSAKGAPSGGGGELSPVASPRGGSRMANGVYGLDRTPGGHWHSRRVHHDD
jgi:hypothetical protein